MKDYTNLLMVRLMVHFRIFTKLTAFSELEKGPAFTETLFRTSKFILAIETHVKASKKGIIEGLII